MTSLLAILVVVTGALFAGVAFLLFQSRMRLASLGRDAREQVAQLASARTEIQTLSAVLDGMAEGIWITDSTGVILRHNDILKEMLYSGQDLLGQRPMALLRNAELHEAVLLACQQDEPTSLEVEVAGVRPRSFRVRIAPLGNELNGSTAVFHDVTELRKLERVRQDFIGNVSHELRTPITAIRGYAETLLSGAWKDPAHAPRMVDIIHRQSERLSELVVDLLDLTRLDAGELVLNPGAVHFDEVARRAAEALGQKAAAKRLNVQLQVKEGATAFADPKAVEQVLVNLLDNAIKYTPEGGVIEVLGHSEGSTSVLAVRDNGPGIEGKHLPRVFERFYRVDRGRSRDMGGTGLGLSIVKHLVSSMNGEVHVTSRPGEGSTFSVTLPSC